VDEGVKKKLFIATVIVLLIVFIVANIMVFFGKEEVDEELFTFYEIPLLPPQPTAAPQTEILTPAPPEEYILPQSTGHLVYVINQLSNDVWLMDLEQKIVHDKIKVGSFPTAGSYEDNRLYVTNTKNDTISVINTVSGEVIDTIITEEEPMGIVVKESVLFVANSRDYTVKAMDKNTKSVLHSEDIKKPTFMVADKNKEYIYVVSNFENVVAILNGKNNELTKNIKVGPSPTSIAISHLGHYLAVTNEESNDISLIPIKMQKETARIKTGVAPNGVAFTSDDKFLWVTNGGSADITIIGLSQEKVVGNLETEGYPTSIYIHGNRAYVTNYNTHAITVIDTENIKVVDKIYTGLGPVAIIPKE
jgi:YVTN family beta-propeller protein